MKYDLTTGRAVGTAVPEHFLAGTNWLDGIRKWAMAGVSVLPTLALGFTIDTYVMDGEYAPNFVELAAHSRSSKAWNPNWDFKSGSEVGWLNEYPVDERRVGDYGALDEGASTNQIRNPRCEGAVAGVIGSGGSLPTNWNVIAANSATIEVMGSGTEAGWAYVELKYSGTPTGDVFIGFDGSTQITAASGETWTTAVGVKVVGGDLTNMERFYLDHVERTAAGGFVVESGYTELASDAANKRSFETYTLVGGGTVARLQPRFVLDWSGSGAIDVTIRIYAPQTEKSATPTSPILPTAGTPAAATRAADIVTGVTTDRASRGWYDTEWDYTNAGVCGDLLEFLPGVPRVGPQGLLVEEGTTNHIRNPRGEGAVAGSPGTFPTNWGTVLNGTTMNVQGSGTEDGWRYVDIEVTGTAIGSFSINLEGSGVAAAVNGQDWTQSVGLRLMSGDFTNAGTPRLVLRQRTGALSALSEFHEDVSIDGLHRRFFLSAVTNDPSVAFVQPTLKWAGAGGAVQFVIRIYAPQLEQKAYPTSVVLPEAGSPAAATRADDTCSLATAPGWWGSREFTVYAAFETAMARMAPARTNVFALDDGSFDNILNVWIDNSGANLRARQSTNAGPYLAGEVDTPWGVDGGETTRVAISIAENDLRYVASKPGGSYEQDVTSLDTAFVGNVTRLLLGADNAGRHLNGFIKELSIRPNRVTDAELEALVA